MIEKVTADIMERTFGELADDECVCCGFPYRCDYDKHYFICNTYEECVTLFEQHDYIDCFVSTMHYKKDNYTQENQSTDGCVLKNITFDLDGEDLCVVHEEAIKLIKWAQKNGGHPIVKLTTNKGMHITIPIEPTVFKHPRETLKYFVERVVVNGKFTTIDSQVTYDVSRIIRVPYTIHSKTMYTVCCVPLVSVLCLSTENLFDYRSYKRVYKPKRQTGFNISELVEYDASLSDIPKRTYDISTIPHRECRTDECLSVFNCLLNGIHDGCRDNRLNGLYFFARYHGLCEHDTYKVLKYVKDRSPTVTTTMIDDIMDRNQNRCYGYCNLMYDNDVCKGCIKNVKNRIG